MIASLYLSLTLQAATPLLPGGGVEIPDPIQHIALRYAGCLRSRLDDHPTLSGDRSADFRRIDRAVADCASERAAAQREADTILSTAPDHANAERRAVVIRGMFDRLEEQERYIVAEIYRQFEGRR